MLTAGLAVVLAVAPAGPAASAPAEPPTASATVVSVFPDDSLTVADPTQLTGRRMNLRYPDCTVRPSDCDEVRLINQLDGFDIDPRITIGFNRRIDLAKVTRDSVFLHRVGDTSQAGRIGLRRLVLDNTVLYGQPERQLEEGTRYVLFDEELRETEFTVE